MDKKNIFAATDTQRAPKKIGQNIIILIALVFLVAVFSALNPHFVDKYNIVSMAQSLAPYAVMSLGVTFVIATGGIDRCV